MIDMLYECSVGYRNGREHRERYAYCLFIFAIDE